MTSLLEMMKLLENSIKTLSVTIQALHDRVVQLELNQLKNEKTEPVVEKWKPLSYTEIIKSFKNIGNESTIPVVINEKIYDEKSTQDTNSSENSSFVLKI